jgi:hypothetical protein
LSTTLLSALTGLRILLTRLLSAAALPALLAAALLAAWIILLSHEFSPCWDSSQS